MSNLQWSRTEPQPDVPVVDGRLWRGIRNALLIEAAVIVPLVWLVWR